MTRVQASPFHGSRDGDADRHAPAELDSQATQQILDLVLEVDYFRNLLASQTDHFPRLQSATANVASLVAGNPHLPGRSAVTALQGLIRGLRRSLESAAALLDQPDDVEESAAALLDRPDDVVESTAALLDRPDNIVESAAILSRWRRGTNEAAPSRSPRRHWEPSRRWDIAAGDDPFVDAPPKPACGSALYALEYHPDVADAPWHKIYQDSSSSAALDPQTCSRRVVLSNLPSDTNVSQVLRGICRHGGILGASIVSPFGARMGRGSFKSAVVEFSGAASAAACVDSLRERPLAFLDARGAGREAHAWLVPTQSYALTFRHRELLQQGATRALRLGPVPVGAVWRLLSLVGTGQMVEIWYNGEQEDLVVDFASLFEAERARAFVEYGWPLVLPRPLARPRVRFVHDSYRERWHGMDGSLPHAQRHVPRAHVEQDWDRAPYKELGHKEHAPASSSSCSPGHSGSPRHDPKPASPSPTEAVAATFDVSPSQLSSYLDERAGWADTEYRIVGSTITLTRRAWSWSISADDDVKLLMANTLHDPDWADEWDQHFAALGAVNMRTWERYGMLARHRREQAAKQGVEAWRVMPCDPACAWGCCDIRTVPVPRVVRDYLDAVRTSPVQDAECDDCQL